MTAPVQTADAELIRKAALGKLGWDHFSMYIRGASIEDANQGIIPFQAWPYLMPIAERWGEGSSEQWLKARQLGATWLAAMLAVWRAKKPKSRALLFSRGELESIQLLKRCLAVNENQIPELRQKVRTSNKTEIHFSNGGEILAFPSTEGAGRGFHSSLVVADEAAFHPYAAENYAAYRPTMADGGQLIHISTSNGPTGWWYEFYQKNKYAEEQGRKPTLKPVFVNCLARPDRDMEWYHREQEAFTGLPQAFMAENPLTEDEAWAQLAGLVYDIYSPQRHVRSDPVPWEQCVYRLFGMDLGGGDPTAVVVVGVYKSPQGLKAHVYGCFYKDDGPASVEQIFKYLSTWHGRARFTVGAGDFAPGGATVSQSLANMGLPVVNTKPDRRKGIELVYMYLDKDWLTFSQVTAVTQVFNREMKSYRWAKKSDQHTKESYATSTPADHHGDALDALRSAMTLVYRYAWTGTEGTTKTGSIKWT